jgi:thiol-disulfide isomerase/thioredoxin
MQEPEKIIRFTEYDTEKAFQLAKQKQLPVLIDFWAPGCKGCKKMEITTYNNPETLSYIDKNFVFIKYDITNRSVPKIQSSPILWTPAFIVFANDGSEVKKTTGYLNDQQFGSEIEIGRALAFLRKSNAQKALEILQNYMVKTSNNSFLPEALYWAGVASYFLNGRTSESLEPHWQKLLHQYPENVWAQKADILEVSL